MRNIILTTAIIVLVSGCAAQKNWGSSGGSKADGTVKMAYTYGMFEVPKTNEQQATSLATARCKAWGYTSASPFDFVNKKCQSMTQNGCAQWLVTKEYQCE